MRPKKTTETELRLLRDFEVSILKMRPVFVKNMRPKQDHTVPVDFIISNLKQFLARY